MKNFEIIFKNGLLIEKETGKRLNLKPMTTYFIQGDDDSFLLEDYRALTYQPKNSEEKKEELEKKFKGYLLEKISSKNEEFFFRIGLPKTTTEDYQREYLFNVVLDEDLYIKSKNGEKWNLCSCVCHSDNLLEGDLGLPFEKVEAESLNQIYRFVVNTYFNKKVSESCNVFDRFYKISKEESPSLYWIKNHAKLNLSILRKVIKIKLKQEELIK